MAGGMMNLVSLFFSLSGRIGRAQWWLGFVVIMAVVFVSAWIVYPEPFSFESPRLPSSLAYNVLMLLLFWPSMAITWKRLQDRNWPAWVPPALAIIILPSYVGPFFGAFWDLDRMATGAGPVHETVYFWLMLLVSLWLLVDNGFLRGTSGPNRYGPDPVAKAVPA